MKPTTLYIRCYEETKDRFKLLFTMSKCKDYEIFLNKLLDIYELLMEKYGVKKIDLVLDYLRGYAIIVRGR